MGADVYRPTVSDAFEVLSDVLVWSVCSKVSDLVSVGKVLAFRFLFSAAK